MTVSGTVRAAGGRRLLASSRRFVAKMAGNSPRVVALLPGETCARCDHPATFAHLAYVGGLAAAVPLCPDHGRDTTPHQIEDIVRSALAEALS